MRYFIYTLVATCVLGSATAQCTFKDIFPYNWGTAALEMNEQVQNDPRFTVSSDTIRASAFQHHLDYFRTVRNMNLDFYGYSSENKHNCFMSDDVTFVFIANDSGLVAYSYMVNYPADAKETYDKVVDSLKTMIAGQFTYSSDVKNDLKAGYLTGKGVSTYFNSEPIVSHNLTYAPMALRYGFLAKVPEGDESGTVINKAGAIEYYRIEILYKKSMPKW